jgi:hypothetical protein
MKTFTKYYSWLLILFFITIERKKSSVQPKEFFFEMSFVFYCYFLGFVCLRLLAQSLDCMCTWCFGDVLLGLFVGKKKVAFHNVNLKKLCHTGMWTRVIKPSHELSLIMSEKFLFWAEEFRISKFSLNSYF